MATGTGVTSLTVNFPDEMVAQVNHDLAERARWIINAAMGSVDMEEDRFMNSKARIWPVAVARALMGTGITGPGDAGTGGDSSVAPEGDGPGRGGGALGWGNPSVPQRGRSRSKV